jgi:phosphoribosyl 1,2-cyclic phosphodiesterase
MRVRFCGVRGSVPWAAAEATAIGSNTPCLHVWDERRFLILDAGTGVVTGSDRLQTYRGDLTILLTHYHWDHVQGLPFFIPLYEPGRTIIVLGPGVDRVAEDWLTQLFAAPHFPLPLSELPSPPTVGLVAPGRFTAGGFGVEAMKLTHPGDSFAYRITGETGDLVYATDHEFGDAATDAALARFAAGATAIVMDAHYTPDELPAMQGRGHSSWRQCAEFAAGCDVKQLWLFHHKPGRSDAELREIAASACRVFAGTQLAAEGVEFSL